MLPLKQEADQEVIKITMWIKEGLLQGNIHWKNNTYVYVTK